MNKFIATLLVVLSSGLANASVVAVVDSGTDFDHQQLKPLTWKNSVEVMGNLVDDDRNGKVDDINGWNFADSRGEVFFPQHLREINPIAYKMIEVIAHKQAGTMTEDEKTFWNTHAASLPADQKAALVAHLNYFGTYSHGTHCSGIVAMQNPSAKIMSARVFPDEPPEDYTPPVVNAFLGGGFDISKYAYKFLAAVSNGNFQKVSAYLKEKKVEVANYSLGMSLQTFAKLALGLKGNKNPTPAQLAAETQKVYAQYEPVGKQWMNASPGTLFVLAAGNDGSNNDILPAFPANIRNDNSITVAAIHADGRLAEFSNYGKVTVDVGAPGVAVISTVPSLEQNRLLPMSGTSMAAPYVTGVASRVKDANPSLTPKQLRTILMGTVDLKAALKDKVVSGGIVNPDRATEAARLAKTMELGQAITTARQKVPDRTLPPPPPPQKKALMPSGLDKAADQLLF